MIGQWLGRAKPVRRVAASIVVQVTEDAAGFEVRVLADPDLDSATCAALLRRAANEVEQQAPGVGGPL